MYIICLFFNCFVFWTFEIQKCDHICQKGSYTYTVSSHTFHCHLIATNINGPTAHVSNTAC